MADTIAVSNTPLVALTPPNDVKVKGADGYGVVTAIGAKLALHSVCQNLVRAGASADQVSFGCRLAEAIICGNLEQTAQAGRATSQMNTGFVHLGIQFTQTGKSVLIDGARDQRLLVSAEGVVSVDARFDGITFEKRESHESQAVLDEMRRCAIDHILGRNLFAAGNAVGFVSPTFAPSHLAGIIKTVASTVERTLVQAVEHSLQNGNNLAAVMDDCDGVEQSINVAFAETEMFKHLRLELEWQEGYLHARFIEVYEYEDAGMLDRVLRSNILGAVAGSQWCSSDDFPC